jgi:2-polyprenyl-3-methyl-5-hydroxy-6-metoxy-1,4-benzoquinol methylase
MRSVNLLGGGRRIVRLYLQAELARLAQRPLRVLDLGSGGADIPLAMLAWARQRGIDLRFTCVDQNATGLELAQRRLAEAGLEDRIELLREDIFSHRPSRSYDCAVGSLFFHHFSDERIRELLRHLRSFVTHSLLVNDLRRTPLHWAGAWLLTRLAPPDTRHDALLSIRRGFAPGELEAMLEELPGASVTVGRAWLFRVWAIARFDETANERNAS